MERKDQLLQKIHNHQARIGVVGLGYVGLPLVVAFAQAGFCVVGVDVDSDKVEQLRRGKSYIADVPAAEIAPLVANGRLVQDTIPAIELVPSWQFYGGVQKRNQPKG